MKAKSCKEGFRSAPFKGGIGNILSKGFEVNIVNNRKEKITKLQTPKTILEKLVFLFLSKDINASNQIFIDKIHKIKEPSCAPQVAANL